MNRLPERLERVALEIAEELKLRLPELAEQWYERIVAIPDLKRWAGPELRERSLENARRDIGREIDGLIKGRVVPSSCPEEVIESARIGEAVGYPLWACAQAYHAGHSVQWQAWSEAVEARRLDAKARRALLRAGSEYMFAYADRCVRWIELEYTRERDRRLRSEEQLRIQLVRDLLEGKEGNTGQLGYELGGWHIALLASGPGADGAITDLSRQLRAEMLSVAADPMTWWAWMHLAQIDAAAIDRRLRSLALPPGVYLAFGEPGEGSDGFRRSHREAQYAALIGARRDQASTRYREVGLEALATADVEQAKLFMQRELGPLAGDDHRAQTLRMTLRAYFAAGQKAAATALVLRVHERTVGNRLRAAEELIGSSIITRRAELETALRVHALMSGPEPRRGAHAEPPTWRTSS